MTVILMYAWASICFGGALLLVLAAIRHQRANFVPRYSGSMGGEIVNQVIWALISLLAAVGFGGLLPWYLSALLFIPIFAFSLVIRYCVELWERRQDGHRRC